MMTSETGRKKRHRGFTILEVLIVLGIIALFAGFFMARFDSGREEELLTRASTEIRGFALKSKKRSFTFRKNQYIIFTPRAFWTTENPPTPDGLPGLDRRGSDERFQVPEGVAMQIFPPGSKKWLKPEGHAWTFRSSGLSDPMKVRFTIGNSYTLLSFNVLTGLADEETILE